MMDVIEIQTASYCNGHCIICPHESISKKFPQGIMSEELFEKILHQIKGVKRIIPYFNNEPFLDPNFIKRLKRIKEICPFSEIEISTNLSLLDKDNQERLKNIKIDELRLSIFGFTEETHSKMMKGLNWKKIKDNLDSLVNNFDLRRSIKEIGIVMIDFPLIKPKDLKLAKDYCKKHRLTFHLWGFMDRGGNVKNYSNNIYGDNVIGCEQDRPLNRMHVLFDGKVVLCCMDWKQEYVLGDLSKEKVIDVWSSRNYDVVRKAIYDPNIKSLDICRRCKLSK